MARPRASRLTAQPAPGAARRIFVIDASPVSRAGITVLLQPLPGCVLVGQADSVDAARTALAALGEPELVILGLDHAGQTAIDALDSLRAGQPERRVALLVPAVSTRWLRQALAHGALAYLSKQCALEALQAKLALALEGRLAACDPHRTTPPAPRVCLRATTPSTAALHALETLTVREREVLDLIGQGCPNPEIAAHLGMATGTVKVHVKNIFRKLGLRSRVDAALWTVGRGAEHPGARAVS